MKVHKLHIAMVHQMYKWHTINLQCCVCTYDEVHILVLLADRRNESSYEVSALSVHQPAHDHNSHCRGCRKDEKLSIPQHTQYVKCCIMNRHIISITHIVY